MQRPICSAIPASYRVATVLDMPDQHPDIFIDEGDQLRCKICGSLLYITPFNDGELIKSAVCLKVKCSEYQILRVMPQVVK